MIISRSIPIRIRNTSDSIGEIIETHVLYSIYIYIFIFFSKLFSLWDTVENYCRDGHDTDDNMAHAHCMLVN